MKRNLSVFHFISIFLIGSLLSLFSVSNSFAAEPASSPISSEKKSVEINAVQPQVQSDVNKKISTERQSIIDEAVVAIQETQHALKALDTNNKSEALKALEAAIGKLDLLLAKEPKIQLAPLDVNIMLHDIYATPETVKVAIKKSQNLIKEGKIQQARALMNTLASDVTINVVNIPLATYPQAIKAIVPLVDQEKFTQAKSQLQAALHTLIITQHVLPLPYLRSAEILKQIDKLSEVKNRTKQQDEEIHKSFDAIYQELQLGESLGYGDANLLKSLIKETKTVEKDIKNNISAKEDIGKVKKTIYAILAS